MSAWVEDESFVKQTENLKERRKKRKKGKRRRVRGWEGH